MGGSSNFRISISLAVTEVAFILISTSSSFGDGFSKSSITRFSEPPYLRHLIAFIMFVFLYLITPTKVQAQICGSTSTDAKSTLLVVSSNCRESFLLMLKSISYSQVHV